MSTNTQVANSQQDASKSAHTKIVLGGRDKEDSVVDNRGKTLMVPSWIVSLIQISIPAIIALAAMYIRVDYIAKDNDKLNVKVHTQVKEIMDIKSDHAQKIQTLEAKIGLLGILRKNDAERVYKGLDRIEVGMKEMKQEIKKDIRMIQVDVKELQQRVPKKENP